MPSKGSKPNSPTGVGPANPEVRWHAASGYMLDVVDGNLVVPLGVKGRVDHMTHEKIGTRAVKKAGSIKIVLDPMALGKA